MAQCMCTSTPDPRKCTFVFDLTCLHGGPVKNSVRALLYRTPGL